MEVQLVNVQPVKMSIKGGLASAITTVLILLFIFQPIAASAANETVDSQPQRELSLSSSQVQVGQLVTISINNASDAQLLISSGNTTFRYIEAAPVTLFKPTALGTYFIMLVQKGNDSAILANTSLGAVPQRQKIWTDKQTYEVGEAVRITNYPELPDDMFTIASGNKTYQLLAGFGKPVQFLPKEEGNYTVTAKYGTAAQGSLEETSAANFTVVRKNSNHKLKYNATYQVGTAVNLTTSLTEYNLLVQTGTQAYHYLGLKGGFSFIPIEEGNYSIQLLLADSSQDTISLWAVQGAVEAPLAAQQDMFILSENITLLLNLSSLSKQHSSFFDRILGRSAIARLTATVRNHENDEHFKIGLIPVMKDVFELVLYSSPEIQPGEYSILIQATTGKETSNYSYDFTWGSAEATPEKKEEAAQEAQEEESNYIEHTFARGSPAIFWLNLTDQLPFDRSLLDILLKRPRLDTLMLYIEEQEENAIFAPKAEHAANDDFMVTIPWDEGIRPDVYKLVAIASASGNTYRTSVIFNWGQENKTAAASKANALKKSENITVILPEKLEEPEPQQQQSQLGQAIKIRSNHPISYELQLANESTGKWQATIKFHNQPFKTVILNNISFKEGELGIDTSSVTAPKHARTPSAYAVDPSFFTINGGLASLTAIAKGGEMYICEHYSFSEKTCESWLAYANLTTGEEYTLNFTAAIAVAEFSEIIGQQAETLTQTSPMPQLIHREQETRVKPSSKSTIEILITKQSMQEKQGMQDTNEALLTETIPEGWSFDYVPENAAIINNSAFSLRINTTPSAGNSSDVLELVRYSIISPDSADSPLNQEFTSTLAGLTGQKESEPAESASTAVIVDGKNTPFSISTAVLSPSGNELGRVLAVNLSYTLKFSITRMAGITPSYPVIFTWPYNSSELELEGISKGCERAGIVGHEGLVALRCIWKEFGPGSTKEFTIQLKPLSESSHTSIINVTYDPAGIIKTAIVKDAPYKVQFTAKEYKQGILLEIWHDSNATLAVKAEGDAKPLLSRQSIGKNEIASLLLENYSGEYFTISVGEEVMSFGDFPIQVAKETNEKKNDENFIAKAAKGIGSSAKKAFASVGNAAVNRAKKAAGSIASSVGSIFRPKIKVTGHAVAETIRQAQENKIINKTIPTLQQETEKEEKPPAQAAVAKEKIEEITQKVQPQLIVQQPIKQQAESKRQEEGSFGKDRKPAPQPTEPKQIPKTRTPKEWFPTYKEFTIFLQNYTPQLSDTALISREIMCSSCDNHTSPANSPVNITIRAENFRQQASQLVEYVPIDWTILSAGGGIPAPYNSTHNRITWQETESYYVLETYSALAPKPSSSGTFKAVLEAEGQSAAGEDHIVLLKPYTISVKDQGSNKVNSTARVLRVKQRSKDRIVADIEVRIGQKANITVSFENATIQEATNASINVGQLTEEQARQADVKFVNLYSIDTAELNFTTAEVTGTAKGTALHKCKEWNFAQQQCNGSWEKLLDLTPGEQYSFTLTPGDPGYAETGVASINTNKSIYHPDEHAKLTVVVLDTAGHLVQGALVIINVTSPSGDRETFTTINNTVTETQRGIYESVYTSTTENGTYLLETSATGNGANSMLTSTFEVQPFYEFDILRNTPVTTDPFKGPFYSELEIKPLISVDYFNITEKLPKSFTIVDHANAEVSEDNTSKYLTWQAGNSAIKVSYTALPPLITPNLFELGKAFVNYLVAGAQHIFEERRSWLLAVDPELSNSNGIVFYSSRNNNGFPYYRNFTTTLSSAVITLLNTGDRNDWQKLRCSKARNECYFMVIDNANDLTFAVFDLGIWNWTNVTQLSANVPLETKSADIECEALSGRCMIAYENATATADRFFSYRIWNGTGLEPQQFANVTNITPNEIDWVKLYPKQGTNMMGVAIQTDGGGANSDTPDIYAGTWNGTNFTNWQTLTVGGSSAANTARTFERHFDCAWEGNSSEFMCMFGEDGSANLTGFMYNGSNWTNLSSLYTGGEVWEVAMCGSSPLTGGQTSDYAGVVFCNSTAGIDGGYWNGTNFSKATPSSSPKGDTSAECAGTKSAGATAINFDCKIEKSGDQIVYTWTDANTNYVEFGTYTISTATYSFANWSVGTEIVANGAGNMRTATLVENPSSDELFLVYLDATRDTGCSYWDGSSWDSSKCNNSAVFETNAASDLRSGVTFDWFRVQTGQPTITFNAPELVAANYNFSGITAPSSSHIAYEGSTVGLPANASVAPINLTEIPGTKPANYSNLTLSDDLKVRTTITMTLTYRVYQAFNFKVTQSPTDIVSIVLTHEGYALQTTSQTADNFYIYVYNFTEDNYTQIRQVFGTTSDTITTDTLTEGFSDFVQGGNIHILVEGNHQNGVGAQARSDMITDFIGLKVNTRPVLKGSVLINVTAEDDDVVSSCSYAYFNSTDANQTTSFTLMQSQTATVFVNTSITSALPDSYYTLYARCNDTLSNVRNTTLLVRTDNTGPSVNITNPLDNTNFTATNNVTFNFNASDPSGGTILCDLRINNQVNKTGVIATSNANTSTTANNFNDGSYQWNVTCADQGNNSATSSTRRFNVDKAAPTVVQNLPVANFFSNQSTIFFNFTPTDTSTIANCSMYLRGALNSTNTSITSGGLTYITPSKINDGTYNWSISCTDIYGNMGNTSNRTITVDTLKPSVYLNVTNNTNFTGGLALLNFTVYDNLDANLSCDITVNGALQVSNMSALNSTITFRNLSLNDGAKLWNVTCYDDSLNINTSEMRLFTMQGNPTVNLTRPLNYSINNGSLIFFNFTANDGDGIANCTLYFDNKFNQTNNTAMSQAVNNTFNLTRVNEGTFNWTVGCTDTLGSKGNATAPFLIRIDNNPPAINLTGPAPEQVLNTFATALNFTVFDTVSTNFTCNLTVDGAVQAADQNFIAFNNSVMTRNQTLTNDLHLWNVTCTDYVGNINTSELRNFTTNKQIPLTVQAVASKFIYDSGETAGVNSSTYDEAGSPLVANITQDIIYTNLTTTTTPWWNDSWKRRRNLFINETANVTDTAYPIDINLTGFDGYLSNCTNEIRIATNASGISNETPSQVIEGDNSTWCRVVFFANLTALNRSSNYWVYYNFSGAMQQNYTSQFGTVSGGTAQNGAWYVDLGTGGSKFRLNNSASTPPGWAADFITASDGTNFSGVADADHLDWRVSEGNFNYNLERNGSLYIRMRINSSNTDNTKRDEVWELYANKTWWKVTSLREPYNGTGGLVQDFTIMTTNDRADEREYSTDDGSSYSVTTSNGANIAGVDVAAVCVDNSCAATGETVFGIITNNTPGHPFEGNEFRTGDAAPCYGQTCSMWFLDNAQSTQSIVNVGQNSSFWMFTTTDGQRGATNNMRQVRNPPNISIGQPQIHIQRNTSTSATKAQALIATGSLLNGNYSAAGFAYAPNPYLAGFNSTIFVVRADSTPPVVTLNSPLNGTTNVSQNFTFFYTPDDAASAISSCSLILHNAINLTKTDITEAVQNNFSKLLPNEGLYNWTVNCTDSANNIGTVAAFNLTVDNTAPTVIALSPNGTVTNQNSMQFNFTAFDNFDLSMLCNVTVDYNAYSQTANVPNFTNGSVTISGIADGFHYWNASCYDNANNTGRSLRYNFTVDAAPQITLHSPPADYGSNISNNTFFYNVTDSGIADCSILTNGLTNQSNSTRILNTTSGQPNNFTISNFNQGLYNWSVNCTDVNGFSTATSNRSIFMDFTPPNLTLDYPGVNETLYVTTIPFNFTVNDNLDPALNCNLTVNSQVNVSGISATNNATKSQSVSGFNAGTHNWQVNCIDNSGFNNISEVRNFTLDSNPSVALSSPSNGSTDGDGTINFTFTPQSIVGFSTGFCDLYINNTAVDTLSIVKTAELNGIERSGLPEGNHTWNINCTDNNGNTAKGIERMGIVDLTNPIVNASAPPNGTLFNYSTITFNFTAFDNFDSSLSCNLTLDAAINQTGIAAPNATSVNATISRINDSIHYWNATCTDNALRSNTSLTLNFTIAEPPTVAALAPPNATRSNSTSYIFNFSPSDNSGMLSSCSVVIDGQINSTNTTITPNQNNILNISGFNHGQYLWMPNCTDAAGNNRANSTQFTLRVDKLGPGIDQNRPTPDQVFNIDDILFNFTATDQFSLSTQLGCSIALDGISNKTVSPVTSGVLNITLIENLSIGRHNWSVSCTDDLGNTNATGNVSFIVNSPDLTLNATDIVFNTTNPDENANIIINVTILNIGGNPATSATVKFLDDNGTHETEFSIQNVTVAPSQNATINATFNVTAGLHRIIIATDPENIIVELNDSNNNASRNISALKATISSPLNGAIQAISNVSINSTVRNYRLDNLNFTLFVDGRLNMSNITLDGRQNITALNLTEGVHTFIAQASEPDLLNGNATFRAKNSTAVTLTYDRTAPLANITTANNTYFQTVTPTIFFNITDNLDFIINYTVFVNAAIVDFNYTINATGANVTLASQANGSYLITVEALDDAGNRANGTPIVIFVDTAFPGINISTKNNTNFSDSTPEIAFNMSDNLDPVINYTMFVDGQKDDNGTRSGGQNTANITTALEGEHNITIEALDEAGNRINSTPIRIFIDSTPPTITIDSPAPNEAKGFTIDILTTISDGAGVGINNVSFTIINDTSALLESGPLPSPLFDTTWDSTQDIDNSTHTYFVNLTVTANDTIGNTRNATTRFIVDNRKPDITFFIPSGNDFNSSFNLSIRIQNYNLSLSNYTIYNQSATLQNNTNASIFKPQFNWTDLVNLSNLTSFAEGLYNISAYAQDSLGNNRTLASYFRVDRTAPNITLETPLNNSNLTGATLEFNFTAVDKFSQSLTCNLTIDSSLQKQNFIAQNGTLSNATIAVALSDGSHYWGIQCIDSAGNRNSSLPRNFTYDATPPAVTLNTPANNTANATRNVSFTYTPNEATTALANCSLLINGTVNTTNPAPQNAQVNNFTLQNMNEGVYLWNVRCLDLLGNTNTSPNNYTLTLDLTQPTASILTQNGTGFSTGRPNITISLSDNLDSILNYTIFVSGEKDDNGTVSNGIQTNATLTLHGNGTYVVIAEAMDEAGNKANSTPINVTIDTVKPVISLAAPLNNTNITTVLANFNFTATDNIATSFGCDLVIDQAINTTRQVANGTSQNITVANFTAGIHNWSVSCTDTAGNANSSNTLYFNVTRPDLSINSGNITFNTSQYEEGKALTISANVFNIGEAEATNVLVEIFNGSPALGMQLYNTTIATLQPGANRTVNTTAAFGIGARNIFARVDNYGTIDESNESNNQANSSLYVPLWNFMHGNVTGDYELRNDSLSVIYRWVATSNSSGNIYVADYDSVVSWNNLTKLGMNRSGNFTITDFEELDTALNTTGYEDSINRTYTDLGRQRLNGTFTVFATVLQNVPVMNSTNNSNFTTGILWDSSDDEDGEFNGTADVAFVTNISRASQGTYGVYDYEIRVPAPLRKYKNSNTLAVVFYLELK